MHKSQYVSAFQKKVRRAHRWLGIVVAMLYYWIFSTFGPLDPSDEVDLHIIFFAPFSVICFLAPQVLMYLSPKTTHGTPIFSHGYWYISGHLSFIAIVLWAEII